MSTITIPAELVPLVRDGSYLDLHGQAGEIGALAEPRDRGDVRVEVNECLASASGAGALLDIVGWVESVGEPVVIDVDAREHRDALVRALLTRVGVERDASDDPEASTEDRVRAKARAGQLADLVQQVEEGGA